MGTWGPGTFENDAALDYVGDVVDPLVENVKSFVAHPEIDEGFDDALAAIALLNAIYSTCNAFRPESPEAQAWRDVFLECFDEQIDGLAPKPGFKEAKRGAVVAELDRFVAACVAYHRS